MDDNEDWQEPPQDEVKFRSLDRFMIHQLNTSLFENSKNAIKLQIFEEDSDEEDAQRCVVPLSFKITKEDRICDETTYLISKLQDKLDAAKTNNFVAINSLADQVDNTQQRERVKNYELIEKIKGGEANQDKFQALRNILMQLKQQKKDARVKNKLNPPPNPKFNYN